MIDASGRVFRARRMSLDITNTLRDTLPGDPEWHPFRRTYTPSGIHWGFDATLPGGLLAFATGDQPITRDQTRHGRAIYRLPIAARVSPRHLSEPVDMCPWCASPTERCTTMADADLHFVCARGHEWTVGR